MAWLVFVELQCEIEKCSLPRGVNDFTVYFTVTLCSEHGSGSCLALGMFHQGNLMYQEFGFRQMMDSCKWQPDTNPVIKMLI